MKTHKSPLRRTLSRFRRLNHRHVLPDSLLIVVCLYASLFLRLNLDEARAFLPVLNRLLPYFLLVRLGTFALTGVYDIIWRYVSMNDALRLVRGILISSVLILATSFMVDIGRLPRTVFFIDTFLLILSLSGIRFGRRLLQQSTSERQLRASGRRTLIYGAGVVGRSLVGRFAMDSSAGIKVIGFIDDDPQKVGRLISGVKVLGTREDLAELIRDYNLTEVLVSIHGVRGETLRDLVQVCRGAGIQPLLFSGGPANARSLGSTRQIGLGDLLNRPSRKLDVSSIRQLIQGRRVLVTGAGGSIGSELSRQILAYKPSRLLLLDHSEFNLYAIDQEFRETSTKDTVMVPLLVDIKDRPTLSSIFAKHRPEVVIHAAAYKHVHLVETNPYSSLLNNIGGTRNLVDLSRQLEVEAFVLISSDKAVNPAGIMGATKRVCELLVSDAGRRSGRRYCSVRFGNVLGSSGSLIPKLERQIEQGGPVTITHKDMTRYFMLIPEAGALVLKAATIAAPGDITVLRMGEPLKIVDVANSLIALMGKSVDEIPMVFTGLRPGEKLFEELYLCGNETKTEEPDILILPKGDTGDRETSGEALQADVTRMMEFARDADPRCLALMQGLVKSTYTHPVAVENEDGTTFFGTPDWRQPPSVELH